MSLEHQDALNASGESLTHSPVRFPSRGAVTFVQTFQGFSRDSWNRWRKSRTGSMLRIPTGRGRRKFCAGIVERPFGYESSVGYAQLCDGDEVL